LRKSWQTLKEKDPGVKELSLGLDRLKGVILSKIPEKYSVPTRLTFRSPGR
jgi:hypothetical protein